MIDGLLHECVERHAPDPAALQVMHSTQNAVEVLSLKEELRREIRVGERPKDLLVEILGFWLLKLATSALGLAGGGALRRRRRARRPARRGAPLRRLHGDSSLPVVPVGGNSRR